MKFCNCSVAYYSTAKAAQGWVRFFASGPAVFSKIMRHHFTARKESHLPRKQALAKYEDGEWLIISGPIIIPALLACESS